MFFTSNPTKFPATPAKIRARIRSYEKKLADEKRQTGMYHDGYGKRYLLAPLYMLLGDIEGCLEHLEWFQQEFPDSCSYAMQYLCWTLALLRSGDVESARIKLSQTMLSSIYVIPVMLGRDAKTVDTWVTSDEQGVWDDWDQHWVDMETVPQQIYDLWTDDEKKWAETEYDSKPFVALRERYVEIQRLKTEPGSGGSVILFAFIDCLLSSIGPPRARFCRVFCAAAVLVCW